MLQSKNTEQLLSFYVSHFFYSENSVLLVSWFHSLSLWFFFSCEIPFSLYLSLISIQVLAVSRVMVAWQPIGLSMGVYDMCHR